MAWQIPQSQTLGTTVAILGLTDSVFVASGVTIASTALQGTITGAGSDHEVLIYGTVANAGPFVAISVGDNSNVDTGEIVTIKASGQVYSFDGEGIRCLATGSQITNEGLLVADANGIFVAAANIINSGTIEAGFSAIERVAPERRSER